VPDLYATHHQHTTTTSVNLAGDNHRTPAIRYFAQDFKNSTSTNLKWDGVVQKKGDFSQWTSSTTSEMK
jgi:hypothetical protein